MRWLSWLRWHRSTGGAEDLLDIDRVLTDGFRNPQSSRQAIVRLTRERKNLVRKRRAVEKGFKRLTRGRTWMITRSSEASPELEVYLFSQALQDANAADQSGTLRKEQVASIDGQIQAIDRALAQLSAFARQAH